MREAPIDHHTALIYIMVIVSAADNEMTDRELFSLGEMVRVLPVFRDYDSSKLVRQTQQCADILAVDDGLDAVLGLAQHALPDILHDTAYAIACEIAAADGKISQEELRLLEMIRYRFDIDRLTAAAIERGVAARNKTL
ncbi:MAG: tellurite resistance TerB family protein [Sphingomonadales bacterium]